MSPKQNKIISNIPMDSQRIGGVNSDVSSAEHSLDSPVFVVQPTQMLGGTGVYGDVQRVKMQMGVQQWNVMAGASGGWYYVDLYFPYSFDKEILSFFAFGALNHAYNIAGKVLQADKSHVRIGMTNSSVPVHLCWLAYGR